MNIFEFRDRLVADYAEFSTSFVRIAADDIRGVVDREYAQQRYWPAPLVQINANYRRGRSVQALAREGALHAGVVFVGGNETQAQYDERLTKDLSTRYPGLRVAFRHTGWTSNWGQQLPGLITECNQADAVVLMTMMRTMLGRGLREALKRPWVSCAARGEKGIERSVLAAAKVALRQRSGQV